jgi:hypothetical protein
MDSKNDNDFTDKDAAMLLMLMTTPLVLAKWGVANWVNWTTLNINS